MRGGTIHPPLEGESAARTREAPRPRHPAAAPPAAGRSCARPPPNAYRGRSVACRRTHLLTRALSAPACASSPHAFGFFLRRTPPSGGFGVTSARHEERAAKTPW